MSMKILPLACLLIFVACSPVSEQINSNTPTEVASAFRWKPNTLSIFDQVTGRVHPGDISRIPPIPGVQTVLEASENEEDPFAQFQLAIAYDRGAGEVTDERIQEIFTAALKGFEKLAVNNDAEAIYHLGQFYDEGWNSDKKAPRGKVQPSNLKAFELYLRAANLGFAPAQTSVGLAYMLGEGVEKNELSGLEWYKKAAMQGDANHQYSLGSHLCSAFGCEQMHEAIEWFEKSANQGHLGAQRRLAGMLDNEKNALYHNPVKAFYWYEKCALQGDDSCLRSVVSGYEFGNGVPQNDYEAYKWMLVQKAIQQKWERHDAFGMELLEEKLTQSQKSQAQTAALQHFNEIQENKESYPYFF